MAEPPCICGHSKAHHDDHSVGPTARYAHLMKPGCCRLCWAVPLQGCAGYRARARICRAVTPPTKDACGKPAVVLVTFKDDDSVLACRPCAMHLQQLAEDSGTNVRVEPLDGQ